MICVTAQHAELEENATQVTVDCKVDSVDEFAMESYAIIASLLGKLRNLSEKEHDVNMLGTVVTRLSEDLEDHFNYCLSELLPIGRLKS